MNKYQIAELDELKRLGATPVKNSGRGMKKGDGILDDFYTVDIKYTDASFNFTKDVWAKLCTDNYRNGTAEPLLKINIQNKVRTVMLTESMFLELHALWLKYGGDNELY